MKKDIIINTARKGLALLLAAGLLYALTTGCQQTSTPSPTSLSTPENMNNWKEQLKEQLPYLGHRNWIVITDMAYPLQNSEGIQTLLAPESFETVVAEVKAAVDKAPHVFAHVYLDNEQHRMNDALAKGWSDYRQHLADALPLAEAQYIPHEELIHRLDEVSRLYRVVLIKTPLTLPYSSVFFELDCGYWDADREAELRK